MKSKAPLLLMEQMIMLLVFALAAALCMQAFVKSDGLSKNSEARDGAVLAAQTAAETLRGFGGDWSRAAQKLAASSHSDASMTIDYDEAWSPVERDGTYRLEAIAVEREVSGLGKADICVLNREDGDELFHLEVSWQEVTQGGN